MLTVDIKQLDLYKTGNAELIPLKKWDAVEIKDGKIVTKDGQPVKQGKVPSALSYGWRKNPISYDVIDNNASENKNNGFAIGETDLIIDVDPRNFIGGIDSYQLMCAELNVDGDYFKENYPTVSTGGGGFHYYCKIPDGIKTDFHLEVSIKKWPGIDFKTHGGYVVCAGSVHPDSTDKNPLYYAWDDWAPDFKDRGLCPEKLINILKKEATSIDNGGISKVVTNEILDKLLAQLPVLEYTEYESWFNMLCACHHGTKGAGIDEFLKWCKTDPEYSSEHHEHLITKAWEALHYGKDGQPIIKIETLYGEVIKHNPKDYEIDFYDDDFADFADDFYDFGDLVPTVAHESGLSLNLIDDLSDDPTGKELSEAFEAIEKASPIEKVKARKALIKKLGITKGEYTELLKENSKAAKDAGRMLAEATLKNRFHDSKGLLFITRLWLYNGKFWRTITDQYAGKIVTQTLDKLRKVTEIKGKEIQLINDTVKTMANLRAQLDDPLFQGKIKPVINCQNGELWLNDNGTIQKLKKHEPESFLTSIINVNYDPDAKCPVWDKAIRLTFSECEDCEDMVRHFEEFMGYILYLDKTPPKWWILSGDGDNGKSKMMQIIISLIGKESVAHSRVDELDIEKDKHCMSNLPGKLLVYDDDIEENTKLKDGTLKRLSGDGDLRANPKFNDGFNFKKCFTVVMNANTLPRINDLSLGTVRRAMVIPFNKNFNKSPDKILNIDRLITNNPVEISGVLNRALAGLKRLRSRKDHDFEEPLSCRLATANFLNQSNAVAFFVSERIIKTNDENDSLKLGHLYFEFEGFCREYGFRGVHTKQKFNRMLKNLKIPHNVSSNRITIFKCIKLRDNLNEDMHDFDNVIKLETKIDARPL